MSAAKKGDRVRVTFEGTVGGQCAVQSRRDFHVVIDDTPDFCIPKSATVEILRPPVAVGDVIETAEQAAALPPRATLIQDDGDVWQRRDGWWRSPGEEGGWADPGLPATVVYLPDGAA